LRIERAGKGRLKCTDNGELCKQHMAWHGVWQRTVVRERPVAFGWLHDLRSAGVRSVELVSRGSRGVRGARPVQRRAPENAGKEKIQERDSRPNAAV
jgi:hypothetical protein